MACPGGLQADKALSTDRGVSKHTSVDLSGSVFLISSDGTTLKLPIPAKTARDPLNWSTQKRIWAMISLIFFSIAGLVAVESPSLMFPLFLKEFSQNVVLYIISEYCNYSFNLGN